MNGGFFSEWLVRYRHHLRMRNYSPRTITSYEQVVRRFGNFVWIVRNQGYEAIERGVLPPAEKVRLDTSVEVPVRMVNDFFVFLSSEKTLGARTLHRMMSTLSSFYRYLNQQGAVDTNPVLVIERPRLKGQEIRYLKHDQVIDLINSIEDERNRLIIRIIYATGVRVSELCGIQIRDIDFTEKMIRIRGKGGKVRAVFIDGESLDEILTFLGGRKEGPLFIGQHGNPISPRTVQHVFHEYAPPGITPHKIRHSYASELYRRSRNLRVVQENLGHTSIKTTEIYLHTDLEERRRVYQEFFPLVADSRSDTPVTGGMRSTPVDTPSLKEKRPRRALKTRRSTMSSRR